MKLSDEMLETIRKNAEQRFAMRKEEARKRKCPEKAGRAAYSARLTGMG
ncbi:MAG: hypothetical protein ACLT76_04275 [Clostridium fessum]